MIYPEVLQKKVIFTDHHNIQAGNITWSGEDGNYVTLYPSEPSFDVFPQAEFLSHGIRILAQPARKIGPLADKIGINSLIYENGIYRAWYLSGDCAFYSESDDGFSWRKPMINRFEINGNKNNNAVFKVSEEYLTEVVDGLVVFHDPNGLDGKQYKMVYHAGAPKDRDLLWDDYNKLNPWYRKDHLTKEHLTCIYGAVSPDGIDWTPVEKPLFVHYSDTLTTIYFDQWLKKYVIYTRDIPRGRRIISRTESDDFINWSPVMPLIWPGIDDNPSYDIYTNGYTSYPGEPDTHLMFPMIYERWNQTSQIRMYSSHDGIMWNPVPGGAVLKPGEPGEWDSEYIVAGTGLVPFGKERIGFLYIGTTYPHKYPRWKNVLDAVKTGWAWWPEGRLSAIKVDDYGEFYTFPVKPAGNILKLNFRTYRAGWVRVGIYNCKGYSVDDCDVLTGDCLHKTVTWKGKKYIDAGGRDKLVVNFKLRSAELYSYEWV